MKKLLTVLFFIATLSGCTYTTMSGFTNYNRSQLMLTPAAQINAQADQAYSQVIKQAKAKKLLNTNKKTTARVKRIANRLIATTPVFRPDAKQWNWEVNVITSDTVNAWCMPGGKIVVYSGIINKLKLTDDEIAIVVGHEIVHALREHSREQQSREMIKGGLIAIAAIMGADRGTLALGNTIANLGFSLPFNRQQETEADTGIFIYPGYKFKCLDGLITNFHLPQSTLLMLVSALAGKDYIMKAYEEAVKDKYRFFSFGDAMFIK